MRWWALLVLSSSPAWASAFAFELGSSYLPFHGGPSADTAIEVRFSVGGAGSIDLRTRVSPMLARLVAGSLSSTPTVVQTATVRYRTPDFGDDIRFNVATGVGVMVQYAMLRGGDVGRNSVGFAFEASPTLDFRLGDVTHFFIALNGVLGVGETGPLISIGLAAGFAFDFSFTKPRITPASARATAPSR